VRSFDDNKFWVTVEPLEYTIGSTSDRIVVSEGFVTDFASIPQSLWSLGLSPHGQYSRAAVIHDYLYWAQACTREQLDWLLLIAMKESNVGGFGEFLVYQGVDKGVKGLGTAMSESDQLICLAPSPGSTFAQRTRT
jgi:hypothetical protein